jgi:hypothetical protein
LAAIRYSQVSDNIENTERITICFPPQVKQSSMSKLSCTTNNRRKTYAVGTVMPDFSQPDTTGKLISLSFS